MNKSEQVNHPSHYNLPGKKECIEQMREDYGDYTVAVFCLTNAYKYLYRAGAKADNSAEQDIAKARWYWNYYSKKLNCYDGFSGKLRNYVKKEIEKYEDYQTKL